MRGLKKMDTPILKGYQIYHNYVRPHMALDEKIPADAAEIKNRRFKQMDNDNTERE